MTSQPRDRARREMKEKLADACRIVHGWPAWKRGILENSFKPRNSYSRLPVREMSDEEREAQRRSFAYGNLKLHDESVTREDIDKAAEAMKET